MSLIPYHPLFDFDQFWNNLKASPSESGPAGIISPKVEITEQDKNYLISVEFPGIDSDKIDVTLDNGVLTLSAETSSEDTKEEKGKVIYQERKYGKYSRSFNVGRDIREEDVKAQFKDGILKLTVPRLEEPNREGTPDTHSPISNTHIQQASIEPTNTRFN